MLVYASFPLIFNGKVSATWVSTCVVYGCHFPIPPHLYYREGCQGRTFGHVNLLHYMQDAETR